FVDVATFAGALLSKRNSLAQLARQLQTERQKRDIDAHGDEITFEYLEYLEADVLVTWGCFEALPDLNAHYQLSKPIHQIYSEASIGKALLSEIGLQPWRALQPDVPDQLIATIMETYYGGRSEAAIRKTAVPGVYADYNSQYPLVFVLLGLWRYLISI